MNAHLTKFKVKTIGKVWRSQLGYLLSGYEDSATILGFTFLTYELQGWVLKSLRHF